MALDLKGVDVIVDAVFTEEALHGDGERSFVYCGG